MFAGLLVLDLIVFAYFAYKYKYLEYKDEEEEGDKKTPEGKDTSLSRY